MKISSLISLGLILSIAPTLALAATAAQDKIAPEVQAAMAAATPTQKITVIVRLSGQANLAPYRKLRRAERLRGAVTALRDKAAVAQQGMRTELQLRQTEGKVSRYNAFWIINGFSVTATKAVIEEIAARADVLRIEQDAIKIVPSALPPEPNLGLVGVPDLWNLSFLGQGVVVANLDSGVDNTHPDLALRWRGGSNSWYDPYNQHTTPYDPTGHGTWTMGVMVGGDANGYSSIGVAPGAQWIAAKIFKDNNTATATAIHQAFQWLLDPDGNAATADAPHVVNNSWAYGTPGCNLDFQADLQALVSAGIVPVFAAGNYGPGANTSTSPANYPEALAVGATNNLDQLLSISSQGPSACGEAATIYPDLVAPGENIMTADLFGNYFPYSGTSLSAPHVTGSLALLLSAFPNMTAAQQRNALLTTAVDLGDPGLDNSFGHGRLNLAAAYDWAVQNVVNPPPVDTTGPDAGSLIASPSPNNGTLGFDVNTQAVRLSATVTDPVVSNLQSNISSAEYFIDTVGGNGSGLALSAVDGVFNSPNEAVFANVPLALVAQLGEGSHTLYVHGQDTAGNWGATSSVALVIDNTLPTISNASLSLSGTTASLSAVGTDTAPGLVVMAEWFEGSDPGIGLGNAMAVSGNALSASINASTWQPGNHTVYLRARDNAGNWSAATAASVNVPLPNAIFSDSFEQGNFAAWNGGVTGTRLAVNAAAKMSTGMLGMQATLGTNTTLGYLSDTTPNADPSYHARFYFNPNGANPGTGVVTILNGLNAANASVFQVQYRKNLGNQQIRCAITRAGGTNYTNFFNIADNAAHSIEIAWQSGTSVAFQVYIDGVLKQTVSKLNTSGFSLETVRFGPSIGLVKTATGALYFDAFASTRTTLIGS